MPTPIDERPFTKRQPKDEDFVLFCEHVGSDHQRWHWGQITPPADVVSPDGVRFQSEWIAFCEECFEAAGRQFKPEFIHDHAKWNGDEPFVREAETGPGGRRG